MAFSNQVVNGTDILLSVQGNIIGCATTHSIEITNAVREVSCKGSGDWTSAEYGRFSWSVSVDALVNLYVDASVQHYDDLVTLMLAKTVVTVSSVISEGLDTYTMSGDAIITSISKNASDNENATYSIQLQGRGALTVG